ncbi:MAG: four helix bundle protein [Patescibacteria group bacterium]
MSELKSQNHSSDLKAHVKYRAYRFSLDVIMLVKDFPHDRIYAIFTDQLLRSATSIGANLVEAKSSSSKREFIKYYEISLKSCNETLYWFCLLRDSKLSTKETITPLLDEAEQLSKMISASLLTMKGKKKF